MNFHDRTLGFSPSVFTFSQADGRLMSLNTTAKRLLSDLDIDDKGQLTLALVERLLTAGGQVTISSAQPDEASGGTKELHRTCQRSDGATMKISRIWSPASSTVLIVDVVEAEEVVPLRRARRNA